MVRTGERGAKSVAGNLEVLGSRAHRETVAGQIMTEDAKYGRSAITDEPFESLKARFLETVSRAAALPPAALRGRV
jgi:hypothetical protein